MPFSIQAILNKKDETRHLPDVDMCFSKTACWKIFGEMNAGPGGNNNNNNTEEEEEEEEDEGEPCEQKSYDSDSGLSDDTDRKTRAVRSEEQDGEPGSEEPEESLQEETDHESAAAETAKSDTEPSNGTGRTLGSDRCKSTQFEVKVHADCSTQRFYKVVKKHIV